MCEGKPNQKKQDDMLFLKVKEDLIKLCDEHPDVVEYQLFREKLEQATSFSDLS